MTRPRLLDLFCGAGGAAMGYHRAGFDVTGVDIKAQPRYPFSFVQGDALEYVAAHGREYDVIHASPPCQAYSTATHTTGDPSSHPDLVAPSRDLLRATGKPYVIENVYTAPLRPPALVLCGTMFDATVVRLNGRRDYLRRHRVFEMSVLMLAPGVCRHDIGERCLDVTGGGAQINGKKGTADERRFIMGMPWANRDECAQAIPPAYTEFIGRQLMATLTA